MPAELICAATDRNGDATAGFVANMEHKITRESNAIDRIRDIELESPLFVLTCTLYTQLHPNLSI